MAIYKHTDESVMSLLMQLESAIKGDQGNCLQEVRDSVYRQLMELIEGGRIEDREEDSYRRWLDITTC